MTKQVEYVLGQWLKCGDAYGQVIAKAIAPGSFEWSPESMKDPSVFTPANNGRGYCVQWFNPAMSYAQTRKRWIRAETIADQRYKPCDDPRPPVAMPAPVDVDDAQAALPLDIEAATNAALIAMVANGDKARDVLRAKGIAA